MASLLVNGVSYEIPESFTLKEMRVIERYAGGHLAGDGYELAKMCGAIHVAIARAKPDLPFEEIEAVVDQIDSDSLEETLTGGQNPPPPESKSEPEGSSIGDSERSSEEPQENGSPPNTGSQDLDTGFLAFHGMSET